MMTNRTRSLWPALLLTLVVPSLAQGVLTYPDRLYFKFNEATGNRVVNWANPGITQYQPVFRNGIGGVWDTTAPVYGSSAMNFNGVANILTGYPTDLSGNFTIECWIRTNTIQAPGCASGACALQRLWGDYTGTTLFRCYVGFYNIGINHLAMFPTATPAPPTLQASTAYVMDGQWHHVALVRDFAAGTITSYVDGNVDQTATYTLPGILYANGNFNLGATGNASSQTGVSFNGAVDEFRWWGEARSQAQIQAGMLGEIPETQTRAIFFADRRSGPAHHLVRFRDFSAAVPGATITSWYWDFGDGNQSTLQNPCHAYTAPGQYTVALTVTDSLSGSNTLTFPNYITVGQPAFSVQSCGQGDLYLAATPPPAGWNEGFLFLSLNTAQPVGVGWFFGLMPDALTWSIIGFPSGPGNLIHFTNVNNPGIWPEAPVTLPPGTFTALLGISLDGIMTYFNPTLTLLGWSNVSRASF